MTPLRNVCHASASQKLVQITYSRVPLADGDLMVVTHLLEMPLQYNSTYRTGSAQKFMFRELASGTEFLVKEVGLNKLTNFKQ